MAFSGAFRAPLAKTFDAGLAAAAVISWWLAGGAPTPIAAYQPKGAASLAASYVNLITPGTYDAAPGVAPTLDASGWVFNGSSQYLNTALNADDGWSVLVRFSGATDSGSDKVILGAVSNAGTTGLFFLETSLSNKVVYAHQSYQIVSPGLLSGVLGMSGQQGYRDGIADGPAIGTDTAAYQPDIPIGCGRGVGGPALFWNGIIQAVAFYNSTLTAPQVAAVSAAMAAI